MKSFFKILTCLSALVFAGEAQAQPVPPQTSAPTLARMLADRVAGEEKAPVTVIDYSSLTCPHCADFHIQVLPRIRADFIETGAVRLIYRDFPLDGVATAASMVARCSSENLYFRFLDALFGTQAQWSRAPDPRKSLTRVALLSGMTAQDVNTCLDNEPLFNGIQAMKADGQAKHGVDSTPTLIINGVKYTGIATYDAFSKIVKPLLEEAKKKK